MANSVTTQLLLDGPRNAIVKYEGVLDTSDVAYMTVVDPALLTGMDNTGLQKAYTFRILKITHNVEDALSVNLFWDSATPVRIEELTGRGSPCYDRFGGLQNNAPAGSSGKISATTEGWSGIKSFSLILELKKIPFAAPGQPQ